MVSHVLAQLPADASAWLDGLANQYGPEQLDLLRLSAAWMEEHSAGVIADSGVPLAGHALGTATILAGMRFDAESLAAALLCGLSDKVLRRENLIKHFGDGEVADKTQFSGGTEGAIGGATDLRGNA